MKLVKHLILPVFLFTLLFLFRPRSSMDRTWVSGTQDACSIPAEATKRDCRKFLSCDPVFLFCKSLVFSDIISITGLNFGVRHLFFSNTSFSSRIEPIRAC